MTGSGPKFVGDGPCGCEIPSSQSAIGSYQHPVRLGSGKKWNDCNKLIPYGFSRVFSQLTADNQHAALGLVLLGVLADMSAVVAELALTKSEGAGEKGSREGTENVAPILGRTANALGVAGTQTQTRGTGDSVGLCGRRDEPSTISITLPDLDMGTPVSRNTILQLGGDGERPLVDDSEVQRIRNSKRSLDVGSPRRDDDSRGHSKRRRQSDLRSIFKSLHNAQ